VLKRVPGIEARLAGQVTTFVQKLRALDLQKRPGTAETLDWAAALVQLRVHRWMRRPTAIADTVGCLLKTREDQGALPPTEFARLLAQSA
jgi:MoxR-like ATPase